jgi:hypothetical protein
MTLDELQMGNLSEALVPFEESKRGVRWGPSHTLGHRLI